MTIDVKMKRYRKQHEQRWLTHDPATNWFLHFARLDLGKMKLQLIADVENQDRAY